MQKPLRSTNLKLFNTFYHEFLSDPLSSFRYFRPEDSNIELPHSRRLKCAEAYVHKYLGDGSRSLGHFERCGSAFVSSGPTELRTPLNQSWKDRSFPRCEKASHGQQR